jgi:hypothetical protein
VHKLPGGDGEEDHEREDEVKPGFESEPFQLALGESGLPVLIVILKGGQFEAAGRVE